MIPQNALKPFKPGRTISAGSLNALVERSANYFVGGKNVNVNKVGKDVLINGKTVRSAVSAPPLQFKFVEMFDDYFTATFFNFEDDPRAVESPNPVKIMKPYTLRKTPFDGASRNGVNFVYDSEDSTRRTASKDGFPDQEERIHEPYLIGDIIYATKNIVGRLGVLESEGSRPERIIWLDLNVDGRAWLHDE